MELSSHQHIDDYLNHKQWRRRRRGRKRKLEGTSRLVQLPELLLLVSMIVVVVVVASSCFASAEPTSLVEQAQALVYLHDSGSGDGYPRPIQQFRDSSTSSSISPSLISAKCWNNYENDNDCKQLNVITGPSRSDQTSSSSSSSSQHNNEQDNDQDNSLITPVVIFESSSTYEPDNNNYNNNLPTNDWQTSSHDNQPGHKLSPSSSSQQQSSVPGQVDQSWMQPSQVQATNQNNIPSSQNNVVLARHRTPPPALREEIFVTTETSMKNPSRYNTPAITDSDFGDERLRPTQPTTSVYVATPQPGPKKAHKTSTEGRKCRDENDDDCDEPDNGSNKTEDGAGEDDDDADGNDNDDGGDSSSLRPTTNSIGAGLVGTLESGSGEAPSDDNEDNEDDEETTFESSGISEPNIGSGEPLHTPRFIEVSPTTTTSSSSSSPIKTIIDESTVTSTSSSTTTTTTTTQQGAQIEVVVHPTLPPSFPTSTTTSTTTPPSILSSGEQDSTTPGTIMPDDTFRSKPVFPPSTTSESSNEIDSPTSGSGHHTNRGNDNDILSSNEESAASEPPIDLATFKPIPIMPQMVENFADRNMSTSDLRGQQSSSSPTDANKLPDRYKFEPGATTSAAPAFKFDNAWRAQPVRAPNFQPGDTTSWQQQQQQQDFQRQRAKFGTGDTSSVVGSQMAAAAAAAAANSQAAAKSRLESAEMLPTLLLYASICILMVLALIFVIMAAAIWRQKTARQRALLHKSQLMGPGQMVASMSHASQLMASNANHMLPGHQQQQPGLLTTYGPPGNGMQLQNKITTSLIRNGSDSVENLQGDDVSSMLNDNNNNNNNSTNKRANGSDSNHNNAALDRTSQLAASGANYPATSSWSTDNQTTSTSGSASGSQESQQTPQHRQRLNYQKQHQQQQQQQGINLRQRAQFNNDSNSNNNINNNSNSLSDGRQNSSSISDSQESQDVGTTIREPQQQQQQQQGQVVYPVHQAMQAFPPPAQQMLFNQPPNNGQTPIKRPPFQSGQTMAPSQSEESFQQRDMNNAPGMMQPQATIGPPPLGDYAIDQRSRSQVGSSPMAHRVAAYPIDLGGGGADVRLTPGINGFGAAPNGGFNQVRFSNGTPPILAQPGRPPSQLNNHASIDYAPFDGPPINQARVALNPLATMSRRPAAYQQHHPGMNRNIYSEDSSSLMTASPSLARTSSSSSFAFNNHHHQLLLDRAVEGKPMIDPTTGRLFNDYSQMNQNKLPASLASGASGNINGPQAPLQPPIVGRKNPGEAWYV